MAAKGDQVTKQEMWELMEKKRFQKLAAETVNLQGDMLLNHRCPKCTLVPPCKHYDSSEEFMTNLNSILSQTEFQKLMSP